MAAPRPSISASSALAISPSPRTATVSTPLSASSGLATSSSNPQEKPPASLKVTPAHKQPPPLPSAPGAWRHPRETEIMHRLNSTTFDKSNVYTIVRNVLGLVASFAIQNGIHAVMPTLKIQQMGSAPTYVLLALRLLLIVNIGLALRPLARRTDTCEDIPLTPSQRHLFGLPPLVRPATPKEKELYITPPRYTRSASGTPRSSSSSLYAETSGSPHNLSDKRASFGGSAPPRSPSGSPLNGLKSQQGGSGERRKLSYTANRSSPLSISEFDASGSVNTPTKAPGTRASVGLNNKWLYEKGKTNAAAWATGSVFL